MDPVLDPQSELLSRIIFYYFRENNMICKEQLDTLKGLLKRFSG